MDEEKAVEAESTEAESGFCAMADTLAGSTG